MTRHSIMIDFNDPRSEVVAEVISNKSCKKILSLLASGELSESELAFKSGLPVSTVNYSMKKLVASGLVERSRNFMSVKGKNVPVYRVSEKHIVISPRTLVRGAIPAVIAGGILSLGIKLWGDYSSKSIAAKGGEVASFAATQAQDISSGVVTSSVANASNAGAWFFIGVLVAVLIVLLWNWSKK